MSDWVTRLPDWAKTLGIGAALYLMGVASSQVYTETRALPEQLKQTNARVDTIRNELLSVRREQVDQQSSINEVGRFVRYLSCASQGSTSDRACANRHLSPQDKDVLGSAR